VRGPQVDELHGLLTDLHCLAPGERLGGEHELDPGEVKRCAEPREELSGDPQLVGVRDNRTNLIWREVDRHVLGGVLGGDDLRTTDELVAESVVRVGMAVDEDVDRRGSRNRGAHRIEHLLGVSQCVEGVDQQALWARRDEPRIAPAPRGRSVGLDIGVDAIADIGQAAFGGDGHRAMLAPRCSPARCLYGVNLGGCSYPFRFNGGRYSRPSARMQMSLRRRLSAASLSSFS
jgi:hypothetical protein